MASLEVRLRNVAPVPLAAEFDCAAGELIALVGPSGSGKTTLLRAVAGLLRVPHLQGFIRVGEQIWFESERGIHLTPQQRCVGLVFQHYALFPHLTALQNVAVGCRADLNIETDSTLRELFQRLGLAGLEQRRPAQLSGGQQQRVALARALRRVTRPEGEMSGPRSGVLLLDEPFSAVDAPTRQTLYRELAALRQQVSTPMVLVTHDLAEARRLADRVVIVDAGETLQSGPPEKVFASPRNARVADLVGIQNHFRGQFQRLPADRGILRWLSGAGQTLDLQVIDKHRLDDGASVTWVMAGEHVDVLARDAGPPAPAEGSNRLLCKLVEVLALGETSLCTLTPERLPAERVMLNLSTAHLRRLGAEVGAAVWLQIPAEAIHIMPQRTGH